MSKVNLTEIPDKLGIWDWGASKQVSLSVTEKLARVDDHSEGAVLIHVRRYVLSGWLLY